ncbi:uncharacterized protein [Amphiura filiformis]|uniref:uncharacterized protein n=1 Tax=Amphiura filiformis TaxID=82378 RepID=UPI003B210572
MVREFRARVGVHHQQPTHHPVPDQAQYLHLRHTADILTRQATEVAQLKTELDGSRARCAQEVAELRERLRQAENEKMQQVSQLTTRLTSVQDAHNKQMDEMKYKYKTESRTLELRVTDLEHTVQRNESTYKSTVSNLQTNLDIEKTQHTQNVATLKEELRCKQDEIVSLSNLVAQLRTYIGDSRQEVQKNSQWQQQKMMLEKRIMELDKECNSLQSTVQLINIRLSSSNEILTIQEAELAKGKIEGVDGGKLASGLLTR